MSATGFQALVRARLRVVGLDAPDIVVEQTSAYLEILAKWNARINLTAFDLSAPTDEAIDRLIVEPLMAAREIRPSDRLAIDVGSGGGSPALPFKIAAGPSLRMVLVEARTRRSAFLREAARAIGLQNVEVETSRVEPGWHRADLAGRVDLVTFRAVRPDVELWRALAELVRPGSSGRVIWFTDLVISQKHIMAEECGFAQVEGNAIFSIFARK